MSARRPFALALVVLVLLAGATFAIVGSGVLRSRTPSLTPAQLALRAAEARTRRMLAEERRDATRAFGLLTAHLPSALGAPEPALPNTLFTRPLPPHEVVGFVPYWTLPEVSSSDLTGSSVLCYYGVSLSGNGALVQSGLEWGNAASALASNAFSTFVAAAHDAKSRVLLTLATTSDSVIAGLVQHPATTSARTAAALEALVAEHGLDGVDIDIEGDKQADREGFVHFVADLTAALRHADPGGEILLDSYAGSAGNPKDFFDVKKLAPYVDAIFIEGYDMNEPNIASATAPLATSNLGYSDVQTLIQYAASVAPKKLILGMPFYGYDFTTRSARPGAKLTSPDPEAVTFAAIAAVGRAAYWDPLAASPYTRFQLSGHWHETYYDDPMSLALKTALASQFHLLGVGAWALGMEGGNTAMLGVLAGGSSVVKLPPVLPASSSS